MNTRTGKMTTFAGLTAAAALALTACADDGGNGEDNGNGDDGGQGGTITLGFLPSWTDGLSTAYLWEAILEEEGYDVEMEELSEAAPLYTGVANGDIDVYPSGWLPATHGEYWDEYEEDLEDLGAYYEGAVLTLAVPEYTDIDSIEELNDNAEDFDNQVIGIEPSAGHMATTTNEVFPAYGLDENFELVESSTTAMLSELDSAIEAEEDIVVTLWRPFWAYGEWDVKDLEDPEGAFGEPETLNLIANAEFSEEFSEVADWMRDFQLTDEEYADLEDTIVNEYEDNEAEGAQVWLEENSELIDELKG